MTKEQFETKLYKQIEQNSPSVRTLRENNLLEQISELQSKISEYPNLEILDYLFIVKENLAIEDSLTDSNLLQFYFENKEDSDSIKILTNTILAEYIDRGLYDRTDSGDFDYYELYMNKRKEVFEDEDKEDDITIEPSNSEIKKELKESEEPQDYHTIIYYDSLKKYAAKNINSILEYARNQINNSGMSNFIKLNTQSELEDYIKENFTTLKDYRDILLKEHKEPQDTPEPILENLLPLDVERMELIEALKMINPYSIDLNTIAAKDTNEINFMIKEAAVKDEFLPQRIDTIIRTNRAQKKLKEPLTPKDSKEPLTESKDSKEPLTSKEKEFITETIKNNISELIRYKLQMTGYKQVTKFNETIAEVPGVIFQESITNETLYSPNDILEFFEETGTQAIKFIQKIKTLTKADYYNYLNQGLQEATKEGKLLQHLKNQDPITLYLIDRAKEEV